MPDELASLSEVIVDFEDGLSSTHVIPSLAVHRFVSDTMKACAELYIRGVIARIKLISYGQLDPQAPGWWSSFNSKGELISP